MGTGLGMFMPSEIQYRNPNQYRDTLQAIGNKEATYLAQMDQFFAQLDEMKREFDVTSEQRANEFEQTLAFDREKLSWQSSEWAKDRTLKELELNENLALNYDKLGLEREELSFKKGATSQAQGLEESKFGEVQKTNAFYKSLFTGEEQRAQDIHDMRMSRISPNYAPSSGIKGTTAFDTKDYGVQSGTDWRSDSNELDWWGL